MIKILCGSCQKPLSLDEAKLPMKEVSFPCPVCKNKVTVDRRTFAGGAPAAPSGETPVETADHPDAAHDEAESFGEKAPIVGDDNAALRQAVKLIGFMPVHFATAQLAREFYMQEFPHVVIIHPSQMTPPPLQDMQAIISLAPSDRRRSFLILVADGLRTFDGNAAFLYGVNLIVAAKDLPQFPQIYKDALTYHERFYSAHNAVTKAMNA